MEIVMAVNLTLALVVGLFVFSLVTPSGRIPVRRKQS
jgi:hypothetical protein